MNEFKSDFRPTGMRECQIKGKGKNGYGSAYGYVEWNRHVVGGTIFGEMVFWYLYERHDNPHEKEQSLNSGRESCLDDKEIEASTAVGGGLPKNGSE